MNTNWVDKEEVRKKQRRPKNTNVTFHHRTKKRSQRASARADMDRNEKDGEEEYEARVIPEESSDEETDDGEPRQKKKRRFKKHWPFPPQHMEVYVSCLAGLETFLSEELTALGIEHVVTGHGATISHPTTVNDLLRCHLYLGTASNVFLRCGAPFTARHLAELRRKVELLPWSQLLWRNRNLQFQVKVTSSKSRLMHTTAIRERVVQGIDKALGRDDEKEEPVVTEKAQQDGPVVRLSIQVIRDQVQISIDTSLTPLHQRAYRLETARAPLREDLAFAFLWSAGWKPAWTGDKQQEKMSKTVPVHTSFLDPFCGAGTIAIEAAAIAAGLAPGRLRPAPLEGTHLYSPRLWKQLVMKSMTDSARIGSSTVQIKASDRVEGCIAAAQSNAKRAGVLDMIDFATTPFSSHQWLENPATAPSKMLLASNLPFGRRIKTTSNDKTYPKLPLYQTLAHRLTKMSDAGNSAAAILLTNDPRLVRQAGFPNDVKTAFSAKHGGIPVSAMFINSSGENEKEEEVNWQTTSDESPSLDRVVS